MDQSLRAKTGEVHEPILEKVSKKVWVLNWSGSDSAENGYGANQAFVELDNSILVFDTGLSLKQARLLDKHILSLTEKKVRYIVNSHDHSDHVFGNDYFWKKYSRSGITILSHILCRTKLESFGESRLRSYRKQPELQSHLQSLQVHVPDICYDDIGLILEIDGTEIILSHPPTGAHTLGDTYVALPKSGVLFAGDILWNSYFPNLEDANLEGWIDTLRELDYLTYSRFVPGHGKICAKEQVDAFLEYLTVLRENLKHQSGIREFDPKSLINLRSCFEFRGSENWKLRMIIDHNIKALIGRKLDLANPKLNSRTR